MPPPVIRRLRTPDLTYQPLPGLPGFRKLSGGDVSGGDPMLIGLDTEPAADPAPGEICADLFRAGIPPDAVPIAYFSDARCVYCRVLSPLLHEIAETSPSASRGTNCRFWGRHRGARPKRPSRPGVRMLIRPSMTG